MQRIERDYDAIVVGSGITGGWAAKELCRARPEHIGPRGGPRHRSTARLHRARAALGHALSRTWRPPRNRGATTCSAPVGELRRAGPQVFWTDDVDNPYSTPAEKPFDWFRARQVGGKSIIWGRQVYRWSDLDFEANLRDGISVDWPIRYADIAPWYDHVDRFIGVSGEALGLSHLPDGVFQPPMEMNIVEAAVRDRLRAHYASARRMTIGRVAVLTRALEGRAPCHYCGPCHRGCITRSYFSSVNATLPAARSDWPPDAASIQHRAHRRLRRKVWPGLRRSRHRSKDTNRT